GWVPAFAGMTIVYCCEDGVQMCEHRGQQLGEENVSTGDTDDSVGVAYAIFAYVLWGIVPLYWRLLDGVPPFELTVHRIVWCALFVMIVALLRSRLGHLRRIIRTPRLLATLTLTSVLISTNWTVYIYCV